MSGEASGRSSPLDAAAVLREILRLVEEDQLHATPGLRRLIEGAAIGLDENARQPEQGSEPNG